MKWLITLLRGTALKSIEEGTRVITAWGPGTVRGGCVHVNLDEGYHHPNTVENDRHVTLELSKVSF
jgi:hypothetical protein